MDSFIFSFLKSTLVDTTKIRSVLGGWLYAYEMPEPPPVQPTPRADSPDEQARANKVAHLKMERTMSMNQSKGLKELAKQARANRDGKEKQQSLDAVDEERGGSAEGASVTMVPKINMHSEEGLSVPSSPDPKSIDASNVGSSVSAVETPVNTATGAISVVETPVNTTTGATSVVETPVNTATGATSVVETPVNTTTGATSAVETPVNTATGATSVVETPVITTTGATSVVETPVNTATGATSAVETPVNTTIGAMETPVSTATGATSGVNNVPAESSIPASKSTSPQPPQPPPVTILNSGFVFSVHRRTVSQVYVVCGVLEMMGCHVQVNHIG